MWRSFFESMRPTYLDTYGDNIKIFIIVLHKYEIWYLLIDLSLNAKITQVWLG